MTALAAGSGLGGAPLRRLLESRFARGVLALGGGTFLAQGAAMEHGLFVAVCQLVGSEGGKVFLGGSVVASPDGSILARGPLLEEEVVLAALSGQSIDRARFESPLLGDLRQMLPHLQRSLERAGTHGLTGEEGETGEGEGEKGRGRGVLPCQ